MALKKNKNKKNCIFWVKSSVAQFRFQIFFNDIITSIQAVLRKGCKSAEQLYTTIFHIVKMY